MLSYEIGLKKPGEKIYQVTLDKLGVSPQAAIVIDDEPSYLPSAELMGIKTILFKDAQKLNDELIKLGVLKFPPKQTQDI